MPSFYTEGVAAGKVTTLQQFTEVCVRAFVASGHPADLSALQPLPEQPSPVHPTYTDSVQKATEALMLFLDLTPEELLAAKAAADQAAHAKAQADQKQASLIYDRYTDLLSAVRSWEPHPDFAKLREFMLEQLTEGRAHDVHFPFERKPQNLAEWRYTEVNRLADDLRYARLQLAEQSHKAIKAAAYLRFCRDTLDAGTPTV